MTTPPSPFTILDPTATPLLRLVQHPTTTVLQVYGSAGYTEIELDPATIQTFLRALPHDTLLAALIAQADAMSSAPSPQPCTALHAACPTCGAEAYPCECLTEAAPLTLGLDTIPDDAPLPIVLALAPWLTPMATEGEVPHG